MSTTVHCPECNAPLELPDSIPSGKRLQCPDCGSAFSPPAEISRTNGMKTVPSRKEGRGTAGAATAPPRRRSSRKSNEFENDLPPRRSGSGSAVVLAAVVVILLLGLGVGGAILLTIGRATAVEEDNVAAIPNAAPLPGGMVAAPPPPGGIMVAPMGPGPAVGVGMPPGGMMGGPGGGMGWVGVPLRAGNPAPEIDGVDLNGKPMKLSDFRNKVVVLAFWGDWSPPCQAAYAFQNHLIDRMKDEPFVLVGVNCDGAPLQAEQAVKDRKIRWRSWFDGGGQMMGGLNAAKYGVGNVPTTFVIDRTGIIRQRFDVSPGELAIDRAVDQAMEMGEKRPANAPPLWKPGSTSFSKLGNEVAMGPYRMKPPAGYVLEKLAPDPKHETYRWKGPKQPDGNVPVMEISLGPAPGGDKKLEDVLEANLAALPRPGLLGWTCTAAERGEVKGLTFARAHWTVSAAPAKVKEAGYQYAAVDGDTLIRISCRGIRPTRDGPSDAAPLTFHRAPAK